MPISIRAVAALTAALCLPATPALADPRCAEVIDATVAELRAGAGDRWSDEAETLARSAAASSCMKTVSGRYDGPAETMEEQPVAGLSDEAGGETDEGPAEEATADDGSWTVGGMTFRKLGGSPSKKPYQRQREQKLKDAEEG